MKASEDKEDQEELDLLMCERERENFLGRETVYRVAVVRKIDYVMSTSAY